MAKIKWVLIASLIIVALVALPLMTACEEEVTPGEQEEEEEEEELPEVTIYIGGSFPLTGPYPEDGAAVLKGFQDYAAYVNETHKLAPWRDETFPENVTLEVKFLDDEASPDKAMTCYEALQAEGLLFYRISGSGIATAMLEVLETDQVGATTMASGPYLLTPPRTIFSNYPIYTDQLAGIADWFMENWEEDRAPRVAYFTNDSFGMTILIPEMDAYLEGLGYEIVGSQVVGTVLVGAPPTTALGWLKDNEVDLTLGAMLLVGSEPSMLEAERLGMGPGLDYEITFGFCSPSHLPTYVRDMGTAGSGCVVAGSYPPLTHTDLPGIAFCNDLLMEYRPDEAEDMHIMYPHGIVEAMIQVEALRLAMLEVPADQLTSADVLNYGFHMITNLDTGGIIPTTITYGPDDIEGADEVRVDQAQNGEVVFLGSYPLRHLFTSE